MKKSFVIAASVLLLSACGAEEELVIHIENQSDQLIKGYGITVPSEMLEGKLPVTSTSHLLLESDEMGCIPLQTDDLDRDGIPDELYFQTDLSAGKELVLKLKNSETGCKKDLAVKTNIRFARKDQGYREVIEGTREAHPNKKKTTGKIWQMEGIAWENDLVAFRNYFDQRNGMDIYAKVTNRMVLDSVGHEDFPSYHIFNPKWGMDVLKVGNSLGAGSIAILYNDSLYRVGDNGIGTCTVLYEGPLRSSFKLDYLNWRVADREYNISHVISIEAGRYGYSSIVKIDGNLTDIELVAGIVNIKSNEFLKASTNAEQVAFYTFDVQSEDTTNLGMGIMTQGNQFTGTITTADKGPGITETYGVKIKPDEKGEAEYSFYTVWERENDRWKTAEGFASYLSEQADAASADVRMWLD